MNEEIRKIVNQKWDEINTKYGLIDYFPYPIACSFNKIKDDSFDINQCIEHAGLMTIKYMALLMIADYARNAKKLMKQKDIDPNLKFAVKNHILRGFNNLGGDGVWIGVIRNILEVYKGHKDWLFIPEFYDLF